MKVIICDDSPRDRALYSGMLKRLAVRHGIDVELYTYDSAAPLLFRAEDEKFDADLIFMDVYMPGITGDKAAARLREIVALAAQDEGGAVNLWQSDQRSAALRDVDRLARHAISAASAYGA